jgi:formylglycine-generating enzyme required for sulfatase activity
VSNNIANDGFGIYNDGGDYSNVTMIYNTFAPKPILVAGTGGNNSTSTTIGTVVSDSNVYFSHKVEYRAYDDQIQKIQLSDFYMSENMTTTLQYCCFLAAIDYKMDFYMPEVTIPAATATPFVALEAFTVGGVPKTIGDYYNFTATNMGNAILCVAHLYIEQNTYGCMRNANTVPYPKEKTGTGNIPDDNIGVCSISWYGAMAYSHWLGGSLPTEAQWEFALRRTTDAFSGANATGVSTTQYPYTASEPNANYEYGWFDKNAFKDDLDGKTWSDYGAATSKTPYNHRIGQKKPSPIGLYDMNGGLKVWIADWYNHLPKHDTINSNNFWYDATLDGVHLNPIHKRFIEYRIIRGSYFGNISDILCSGERSADRPIDCRPSIGCRPCWNLNSLGALR